MKKEYYFVVSVSCNRRNMKEEVLAEYLKSYKNCLVEFGEEYTPDVLIADLNQRLDEINASNKRCRDIRLRCQNGMFGEIIFVFESDVSCDTHPAIMVLRPVRRWLYGSSRLGNSDAE